MSDKLGKKRPLIDGSDQLDSIITGTDNLIPIPDAPEQFEDTAFVSGDSPVTLDLNTVLGRNAEKVSILNDGAGSFKVELSTDGAAFGAQFTLKSGEEYPFTKNISVDSVRITHISDSAYRVLFI